jgi:hypothetical protein
VTLLNLVEHRLLGYFDFLQTSFYFEVLLRVNSQLRLKALNLLPNELGLRLQQAALVLLNLLFPLLLFHGLGLDARIF